jgi:two-component system alkaline phosphatase synthesis response regulator PhoP
MSTPVPIYLLSREPDGAWARRWRWLVKQAGWDALVVHVREMQTQISDTMPAIALLDPMAAAIEPGRIFRQIKETLPRVHLIATFPSTHPARLVVEALESGADDWIDENLNERLIEAKFKVHLRRLLPILSAAMATTVSPRGLLRIDDLRRCAEINQGGAWKPLPPMTATELGLLRLLVRRSGIVLERQFILETLWGEKATHIRSGTIDKHVESLRRKLGALGKNIRTVYGTGYRYAE